MIDLLKTEKQFISSHIKEGGTVVDFTMGNGHDTLWLSKAVGKNGKVYAFDIQKEAIESTAKLLEKENADKNYTLILDSHHNVKNYVKEPICAGMFNLGYLPGGDKTITTLHQTSLQAMTAGIELLAPDGAILCAVYPGHVEGTVEGNLIEDFLSTLDRRLFCATKFKIVNSPTSPFFFLIEKK